MTKPRVSTPEQLAHVRAALERTGTVAFYDKLMSEGREPVWIPSIPDPVALKCYRLVLALAEMSDAERAAIDVDTIVTLAEFALFPPE